MLPEHCPIENTLKYIGKKWTINIIRDLFFGRGRFRDFLISNPEISTKMLSARLREMEEDGIIEKRVVSKSPVVIEYGLTRKGMSLNRILYEMAVFSIMQCPEEVFQRVPRNKKRSVEMARETFLV